ncbi:MAG: DUF58 domain-containing protein [Opitutaceae bacterium]|nr:DUF58 domain-containing protein [Opitutaceae bacterium]
MNAPGKIVNPSADWQGAGRRDRWRFRWSELLWSLIYPARKHRIVLTVPGLVLIGLALGIGSAAYNTASNILFITLSLLLACLILSGLMSWFNLRGVCWRLLLSPPARAGQETPVTLELWNRKTLLPTYGLWFELGARPVAAEAPRAETTFRASSAEIRAALARDEQTAVRTVLPLRERLDPGGQARLDWLFTPARRGRVRVELESVGSLFPFGFLRKNHGTRLQREMIVWPAPVGYQFVRRAAAVRQAEGERVARPGASNDLLALRRYQAGDSHRLIHWKASARLRQLLVRQFAAESAEGYSLWVETPPGVWTREDQFELLCRFAATLAEDLFTAGRLTTTAVNGEEPVIVRRVRDLESFLDRLALLEWREGSRRPETGDRRPETGDRRPEAGSRKPDVRSQNSGFRTLNQEPGSGAPFRPRRHAITFVPEGVRGVAAHIDGEKTATT